MELGKHALGPRCEQRHGALGELGDKLLPDEQGPMFSGCAVSIGRTPAALAKMASRR